MLRKRLGLLVFFLMAFGVVSALAQVIFVQGQQTIASIALSNSSTTTGLSSGTAVGTLSVTLSPMAPTFSYSGTNLHLSTTGTDSASVCNSTNGADNGSFQITNGDTLATNGTLTRGSKSICVAASEGGVSANGHAFTVSVGTLITANSGTGCTGTGTSASPWNYKCLQNAFDSAVTTGGINDTVSLPSGNYQLNTLTDAAGTTLNKAVNVVGAGSGNTFDVYGHINNGSGTTPCPTSLSTVTCIYPRGTSFAYGSNPANGTTPSPGTIKVGLDAGSSSCSNTNFSNIAFDSSLVSPGGDDEGLLNFEYCPGPITLTNLTFYAFDGKAPSFNGTIAGSVLTVLGTPSVVGIISVGEELIVGTDQMVTIASYGTGTGKAGTYNLSGLPVNGNVGTSTAMTTSSNNETQIYSQGSSNVLAQNSLFGIAIVDGSYSGTEAFETVHNSGVTINNSLIWQAFVAPTNDQNYTLSGTITQTDVNSNLAAGVDYTGPTGCKLDPGNTGVSGCLYTPTHGTPHVTFSNNYFTTGSLMPNSIGGAVNDPGSNGNVSDFNVTGNWVVGTNASIAACTWITSSAENFCNGDHGPALNATADATTCALSHDGSYGFNITNNSIIGSSVALLDGQGIGTMRCYATGDTAMSFHTPNVEVFGLDAEKNYFSGPNVAGGIAYTTNAQTISPTVIGNYCAGGQTFTQTNLMSCATSGFTTLPTVSFTLGPLGLGGIVPINSPTFTAQYGAVQWLASPSSGTPTTTGQSGTSCNGVSCFWAYVPPASLAGVAHGNTVYMWVMDKNNNISSAYSLLIP